MSYTDTVRRYVNASYGFSAPKSRQDSADKLPMSDWSEARRDLMTPGTVAANHALHVESAAYKLREAIRDADISDPMGRMAALADVEDAARILLQAIGEGEL